MYKIILLTMALLGVSQINSQSLAIDFESSIMTDDFIDFDGGIAEVIPNPQINGINQSATVGQITRNGGQIWAGSKIILNSNLVFLTDNVITMKVFTTAPVGTVVKFKLESSTGSTERDAITTTSSEWEMLRWDFTGTLSEFNEVVFMFDFGNLGDGSVNSTFLFDDVTQSFGGQQIDLPVTFDNANVNYTMTDFEGGLSMIVADPTDDTNLVGKAVKGAGAGASSGTTIGTPAGFRTFIPLSLEDSKMTVRVWSPNAGIPVRLKVEDHRDPTHTCETETNTTKAGEWEVLEFDFANQAPGTESLSVGLSQGWVYNMASIFFNFGSEGSAVNEATYYFDDVRFGGFISNSKNIILSSLNVYPNPTSEGWMFYLDDVSETISEVGVYGVDGTLKLVKRVEGASTYISTTHFVPGTYIAKIYTNKGAVTKLILRSE